MAGRDQVKDIFSTAAQRLEDAFFKERDRVLMERLRALKAMEETKETLSSVSGITDDRVLTRLVELGVQAESLAALAAVPLVEVAWADGVVSPAEREAVLTHANSKGIQPGSVEHDLLERWLEQRPEPKLMEAWQAYVEGLCARLDATERAALRDELLHATLATATASGGVLGLHRVSKREREVLDRLAASFSG